VELFFFHFIEQKTVERQGKSMRRMDNLSENP